MEHNCIMDRSRNDSIELEEMRNQISLLKDKLEGQKIINGRLLKESMKGRLRDINGAVWKTLAGCIAAIALCCSLFIHWGMSAAFIVFTVAMLVFSASMTVFHHWQLMNGACLLKGNLVDVTKELLLLKKRYENWKRIAFPLIAAWLVWLAAECYMNLGDIALPFCTGTVAGSIIGGHFGFRANRRTIREIEDLMDEIRSLEEEGGME